MSDTKKEFEMLMIITEKLCAACGTELHAKGNKAMYLCKDNYYCAGCIPEGADYEYIIKPPKKVRASKCDEKSLNSDTR